MVVKIWLQFVGKKNEIDFSLTPSYRNLIATVQKTP